MTTPTHKITRFAIFLTAALATLALAAPLAQANTGASCTQASPYPGWVSVIDEQGVPVLYRVAFVPGNVLSCASASSQPGDSSDAQTASRPGLGTTMGSPYQEWVFVIDEQGIPWLFPRGQA